MNREATLPLAPVDDSRPADQSILDVFEAALQRIETDEPVRARMFVDQVIPKGRKNLREILYEQIRVAGKIRKRIEQGEYEKALKWCIHLISDTWRETFRAQIAQLTGATPPPETVVPETVVPTVASDVVEVTVISAPEPAPHVHTRLEIAYGFIEKKLEKDIRRYDAVIAEIVQLTDACWLHEGKPGKFRLGIGRTDLLVLAELLTAGIGTEITADEIAKSLGLNVSTVESAARYLQDYLLRKTGYVLEGKTKKRMRLVRGA
jgi:hypothetical protein